MVVGETCGLILASGTRRWLLISLAYARVSDHLVEYGDG